MYVFLLFSVYFRETCDNGDVSEACTKPMLTSGVEVLVSAVGSEVSRPDKLPVSADQSPTLFSTVQ